MNLTDEELKHCDCMLQENWDKEYHYAGGFQTKLMRAIEHADHINLKKLEVVYPTLVNAFREYSGQTVEKIEEAQKWFKEKGVDI